MLPSNEINAIRKSNSKSAIVFLHGFSGSAISTWSRFLTMFGTDRQFMNWDLYSVGYPSALTPDIPFWKKEPPISLIAKSLLTQTNLGPLSEYQTIAIVAHSMGGLVAQAACIESKEFAERVSHLVHYGTPSLGLRKAKALGFYKSQIADMKAGGKFIETLRGKWDLITTHGLPFSFLSVAGNQDDFVPSASSLSPFLEEHQAVIAGNHVDIVRPVSQTCAGVCLLKKFLESGHYKAGPIDSAALAVERKNFQAAINTYEMHLDELDEKSLGTYALALASLGETEAAIELLQNSLEKGTDIQGILGGRLKRRWLDEGKSGDAEQARELYTKAFRQAESKGDHSQCHYHAINVAFMVLASDKDYTEMEKWAKVAMDHAEKATRDKWAEATIAEAHLYLGDIETAKIKYKIIFTLGNFSPRELASIAMQSLHISEHINSTDFTDFINSL